MKRNDNERAAEFVFGEMADSESAQMQAELTTNADLAQDVATYRQMRRALRAMSDVPDHQMSNDRLRDAILGQGLKPKPTPLFDWSWLGISAATCLAVAAVVVISRPHRSEPHFVGFNSSNVVAMETPSLIKHESLSAKSIMKGNVFHRFDSNPAVGLKTKASPVTNEADVVTQIATPKFVARLNRRVRNRADSTSLYTMSQNAAADESENPRPSTTSAPLAIENAPARDAAMDSSTVPTPKPDDSLKLVDNKPATAVIVISPDRDQDTGTQSAKEVDSGTNVVVGG